MWLNVDHNTTWVCSDNDISRKRRITFLGKFQISAGSIVSYRRPFLFFYNQYNSYMELSRRFRMFYWFILFHSLIRYIIACNIQYYKSKFLKMLPRLLFKDYSSLLNLIEYFRGFWNLYCHGKELFILSLYLYPLKGDI